VSVPRVAAAVKAAIPTSAYAPAGAVKPSGATASPKVAPSAAPRNSDGVKTPPEPPLPIDIEVAISFRKKSTASSNAMLSMVSRPPGPRSRAVSAVPCSIPWVMSKPLPRISGKASAMAPTVRPPSAVCAGSGSWCIAVIMRSKPNSNLMKPVAASPASSPSTR